MNGMSLVKQTGREQYTSIFTGKLELMSRQLRVEEVAQVTSFRASEPVSGHSSLNSVPLRCSFGDT